MSNNIKSKAARQGGGIAGTHEALARQGGGIAGAHEALASRGGGAARQGGRWSWREGTLGEAFALPGVKLSEEAAECFRAWFRRNFDGMPGRIGRITYERAGELDDAYGRSGGEAGMWYGDAYERALLDHTKPLTFDEAGFLLRNPLVAMQLALGVTDLRGLRCLRRGLTHEINRLQQRAARSRYYAADNARRRRLAAERRRIRRRAPTGPCPTPEEFREAFARAKESGEARLRFGAMVHDLECHVDNCLRFGPDGEIVGRNGGIRAWIAANAPELSPKYKTIMRYKALAKRLRQAVGLRDPAPTAAALPPRPPEAENHHARDSHVAAARAMVAELLAGDGPAMTTQELFERVDRLLDARPPVGGGGEKPIGDENYYAEDSQYGEGRSAKDGHGAGRSAEDGHGAGRKPGRDENYYAVDSQHGAGGARSRRVCRTARLDIKKTLKGGAM